MGGLLVLERSEVPGVSSAQADCTKTTRRPVGQGYRSYASLYTRKIGYTPAKNRDQRPFTECCDYSGEECTSISPSLHMHSSSACNLSAPTCEGSLSDVCKDESSRKHHPCSNTSRAYTVSNPVYPMYRAFSRLPRSDDENIIQVSSRTIFEQVLRKFKDDWVKGTCPSIIKTIFVIKNKALENKWMVYKATLPKDYQSIEEYYHGTRLCCNISWNKAICPSEDCSICRISQEGFKESKIGQNITYFQRFGKGFYLAPKSSKSHAYTQGAHNYRAMLICEVCPGKKHKLKETNTKLRGPPPGYHSIYGEAGESLNYDEILLHNKDAILPKYVIVYEKSGVHRLTK